MKELNFALLYLVYKCLNNMAPENLASLFEFCGNNHNYSLRNVGYDLVIPKPKTETLRKSFSYMGGVIWNQLPTFVRVSINIPQFKRNMKTYLIIIRGLP